MIPNFQNPDPLREGITAKTVVLSDIVDGFMKSTPEGVKWAHQDNLISLSKNVDRYSLTGESIFATRALDDLRELIRLEEHWLLMAKMLRTRLLDTRLAANKSWLRNINPTEDEQGESAFGKNTDSSIGG